MAKKIDAKRFNELLAKRKTTTYLEEKELIEMAKHLTPAGRAKIDPKLLDFLNKSRLESIFENLDKIGEILADKTTDKIEKAVDKASDKVDTIIEDALKKTEKIVDSVLKKNKQKVKYFYKMTYLKEEKLFPNFGKGNWKPPLVVEREYSFEADNYVMGLSNPQACKIEKAIWNGEKLEAITWHVLYDETEETGISTTRTFD